MSVLTQCIYIMFGFFMGFSPVGIHVAKGADYSAELTRPASSDERIDGLKLSGQGDVFPVPGINPQILLQVSGKYTRQHWSLASNGPIVLSQRIEDKFTFKVTVSRSSPRFEMISVGPRGETQTETIEVTFTNWEFVKQMTKKGQHTLSFGIGPTSVTYKEGSQINYASTVVTGKAAYNFRLPSFPRFDISANLFVTVFNLQSSLPVDARFLGVNARAGYALVLNEDWRVSILAGFYVIGMFNTNNQFGVQSLMGPQLYPAIMRTFGSNAISAYAKFSPVGQDFGLADLSQRELAGGVAFSHAFATGLGGAISLDFSSLNARINSIPISITSASASATIYWIFSLF